MSTHLKPAEIAARILELGERVDEVDELLINLLAYRRMMTLFIGELKAKSGAHLYRKEVESVRLEKAKELARKIGLDPEFASYILYAIMGDSLRQQVIHSEESGTKPSGIDADKMYPALNKSLVRLLERVA